MITPVPGEVVQWQSRANGERYIQGVVQKQLDPLRTLVRDRQMRYAQVISTERLSRPRSVPTIYGPSGKVA